MIKVIRETKFWIDGESFDCNEPNEYILTLDVGKHIIKFIGYSPVAITIVDQKIKTSEWLYSYTKWEVYKKDIMLYTRSGQRNTLRIKLDCHLIA